MPFVQFCADFSFILVTLLYNHTIEPKVNQNVQAGDCVDVGSVFCKI